jgi:4-hydroxy-L-threonine phosphate dehydrogenase PdxA
VQESIEKAVRLVQAGEARAVVTNPISKAMLYRGGFAFRGIPNISLRLRRQAEQFPIP